MIEANDPFEQGGGDDSGLGSFTPASEGKKRVSQQTIVLALILVVGGGLLFGMRKFGMGPGLTFADVAVDYEPGKVNTEQAAEYERVMALLDRSVTPTQVPSEVIARDPFILMLNAPVIEAEVVEEDDGERRAARLRAEVEAAAARMQIQSVMGGRVPLVRVGDKTLKAGEAYDEHLVFDGVDGRFVRFSGRDGRVYVGTVGGKLTLEEE